MNLPSRDYLCWSRKARKAMIDQNLTNKKLAAALGYSQQFITAVINGRRESPPAIKRVSKKMGIELPEGCKE